MSEAPELEFELVVPCYNEEKNLQTLVERTVTAAKVAGFSPQTFQLVLVQNGSKDASSARLQELARSEFGSWFRALGIERNEGYGNGIQTGLVTTTARYVGWTHADLQADPLDAFKALALFKTEGSENLVVKGVREGRDWKERFVSRTFELFGTVILGLHGFEINAQPKVFGRELLKLLVDPPKDFAFDLYFIYQVQRAQIRIIEIPVQFPPRVHGVSNWASTYASRYRTIGGIIRYMFKLSKAQGRL